MSGPSASPATEAEMPVQGEEEEAELLPAAWRAERTGNCEQRKPEKCIQVINGFPNLPDIPRQQESRNNVERSDNDSGDHSNE